MLHGDNLEGGLLEESSRFRFHTLKPTLDVLTGAQFSSWFNVTLSVINFNCLPSLLKSSSVAYCKHPIIFRVKILTDS